MKPLQFLRKVNASIKTRVGLSFDNDYDLALDDRYYAVVPNYIESCHISVMYSAVDTTANILAVFSGQNLKKKQAKMLIASS